jgi:hypothetical protein
VGGACGVVFVPLYIMLRLFTLYKCTSVRKNNKIKNMYV